MIRSAQKIFKSLESWRNCCLLGAIAPDVYALREAWASVSRKQRLFRVPAERPGSFTCHFGNTGRLVNFLRLAPVLHGKPDNFALRSTNANSSTKEFYFSPVKESWGQSDTWTSSCIRWSNHARCLVLTETGMQAPGRPSCQANCPPV